MNQEQGSQESTAKSITITKKTGYIIHGSTGCSCCRDDNILEGIKDTEEEALESAIYLHDRKAVCSQYSSNGIYSIYKIDYEEISDERIIIGDRIFDDKFIYESGQTANDMMYEGKLIHTIQ